MIDRIHWLGHASFYIEGPAGIKIYIDPYHLKDGLPKADIILITHAHYDHCSAGDIKKIATQDTVIFGPKAVAAALPYTVTLVKPGEKMSVKGLDIETVSAYNPHKSFHPRADGNVGFIVTIDGTKLYHAGDTDLIPEMEDIRADIALLPIGGTYTMDAKEAAQAAALIRPKIAIPMHFGSVVGSSKDAKDFQRLCSIEAKILEQE